MDDKKKIPEVPENPQLPKETVDKLTSVPSGTAPAVPKYESKWQQQMDDVMGQIRDRKPFSFDINGDAFYDLYKNQAIAGGRLALEDTVGKLSAMTGGYGNSYVNQSGQQAYQGYLQGINDKIPQLYDLALNMYDREGDRLQDRMQFLGNMDNRDYGRFQDDQNRQLQADQIAYGKQKDARANLMALIQMGYKPNPDELAGAGITPGQFEVIWNTYHPVVHAYSGGGGNGGGPSGNGWIHKDLYDEMVDSGRYSDFDIDNFLHHEVKNGYLSGNDANGYQRGDYDPTLTNAVNKGTMTPQQAVAAAKKNRKR